MVEPEITKEIFKEIEEDVERLLSLVRIIKTDLITKNYERAKDRLERSSFLAQKIDSNLFRLGSMIEKRADLSR